MGTEPHVHDDTEWRLPTLEWAPGGDQSVSTRLLAAAKDECPDCVPALAEEAARTGDALAVTIMLVDVLLNEPYARTCVPGPALTKVFERIRRMGNPDKTAVVGMLRSLGEDQRLAVARDRGQAVRDYITAVGKYADDLVAKRQQRPWWLIDPKG